MITIYFYMAHISLGHWQKLYGAIQAIGDRIHPFYYGNTI
jgi:hypothetical protein